MTLRYTLPMLLLLFYPSVKLSAQAQHQANLPVLIMAVSKASIPVNQGRIDWITEGFSLAGFDLQLVLVPQPAARALISAASGAVDGDLYRTEEAARIYPTLVPIKVPLSIFEYHAWFDAGSDCPEHPSELAKLRPITILGSKIYDATIAKSINGSMQVGSAEAALYSLKAGRGDYIVASAKGVKLYSSMTGIKPKTCLPDALFSITIYTFMHIRHLDKLERLEKGLRQAKAEF